MVKKVVTFDNLKGMPLHTITSNLISIFVDFKVDNKAMTNSCGVVGVVEFSLSQYIKEKWNYGVHKERLNFLSTQMKVNLKSHPKSPLALKGG